MSDKQAPWCCTGYAAECPLCPDYGTRLTHACLGHPLNDDNRAVVHTARLHSQRAHPDYEYATTEGPRKQWLGIDDPPSGEDGEPDTSWERNTDAGRPGMGWDRFDYTEQSYWRRRKPAADCPHEEPRLFIEGDTARFQMIEPPPPRIVIPLGDGTPLVAIHPNGQLEYGPCYTPDEAARQFWNAMRHYMPSRCPNCGHVGLEGP